VITSDKASIARQNAQLSTGPRTRQGKAWSKLNTLKHGILAADLQLIHGHQEEDRELLEAVRKALYEEYQPATATEALLVERIFTCVWRLKRVLLAEAAMIQKTGMRSRIRSFIDLLQKHGDQTKNPRETFYERLRTSCGCYELKNFAQAILEHMEKHGLPLPESMSWYLDHFMGGKAGFTKVEMICGINSAWADSQHFGATPQDLEAAKEEAIKDMKSVVEWFALLANVWDCAEEDDRIVQLQASLLPSPEECEKIKRYEAHIHRIFMSSLHELQRIQAQRKGTLLPLAAALDVTTDGEGMR
jgi:hypothetical protein